MPRRAHGRRDKRTYSPEYGNHPETIDRVWPGFLPVPGGRLQDAELVTVRIGKDVLAPARLGHGPAGESSGSQREDTLDFAREVNGAQVQMQTPSPSSRRSVFTEATIGCEALAAQIEAFCAVPARSLEHHMTSGVTDTPRPGQPPAAGALAWHTLGGDQA